MTISAKTWNEYISRLSQLNQTAAQKMQDYINQHGTTDTKSLIDFAHALITKYGEGSAELACQMYDALAETAGVSVPAAEPAVTADYREVAKMVNATKQSTPQLQRGVSRLVKRAAADTTLHNARRDGAEFAWVPHGDTCAFCLTLASRGWQRAGEKTLKGDHAEHIHANCDCEYAIRFNSNTNIAGYDPEKYLQQYRDAGGDINKMRRIDYAAHKDRINAQKRAAYAAKKDSTSEELSATLKPNKSFEELSLPEQLAVRPQNLANYTPASLKENLEDAGFKVNPLSKGRLKGVPFEDGGGYKINFGPSGLLQYHPDTMSHHDGAYYKISTEEGGIRRYELDGAEKQK